MTRGPGEDRRESPQNATTIEPSESTTRVRESRCAPRSLERSPPPFLNPFPRDAVHAATSGGDLQIVEMLGWKAQTLTRRLLHEYEVLLEHGCEIADSETLLPWDIAARFRGIALKWETVTTSQSPQHGLGC